MWPKCMENLMPFRRTLSEELPAFIREGFERNGITDPQEMFVPVRIVAALGRCTTDKYIDCPNMPEGYLDDPEYLPDMGMYHWFDFDILDRDRKTLPLRAVFNIGNVDAGDGIWGVAWDRNTGTEVVHFRSPGDYTTRLEVVSQQHIDSYQPHNIWFPDQFGPSIGRSKTKKFQIKEWDEEYLDIECSLPPYWLYFSRDLELETLIGMALRWCGHYG